MVNVAKPILQSAMPNGTRMRVAVAERAAGVDDVGDVAVPFVRQRSEQRLLGLADDDGRVVEVEEEGADGVGAHRADAVGEDEPALVELDR